MDQIIKQISEGLANHSSRRGFLSTVGKATLGVAALITGQGFFTANALAANSTCCSGPACSGTSCCALGLTVGYLWCCVTGQQEKCAISSGLPPCPKDKPNQLPDPCTTNCNPKYSNGTTCVDCYNTSGYKCTIYPAPA